MFFINGVEDPACFLFVSCFMLAMQAMSRLEDSVMAGELVAGLT